MSSVARMSARRRLDLIVALAGLGAVTACAFTADNGMVGSFERGIFEAINGLPGALSPAMVSAQYLGVRPSVHSSRWPRSSFVAIGSRQRRSS